MKSLKSVLIMAGGTGGHVFPALAIAKALMAKGIAVYWLGTKKGIEAQIVPEAKIPLHFISISGVRGKGLKTLLMAPWCLGKAVAEAAKIIQHLQPDVVLGFGGFVSGPGGLASILLRKPLVIHEQNAKAGLTNKYLSKFAKKVLEGFPNTFPASSKVILTGNPVRNEIANLGTPAKRLEGRTGPIRLLVLGGSLGAAAMNELVPRTLSHLPVAERPEVKHQTGPKGILETLKHYDAAQVNAEVMPFITDMAKAYEWADIVLCRAGASTIAELSAAGLGAILVPYPHAVDDHQTKNALYLANQNAAILIQQKDLTEKVLLDCLEELKSPAKRLAMANAAFNLRNMDTTEKVLKICEEIN